MSKGRTVWMLLPNPVRRLPADLVAVLVCIVLANFGVFAPVVRDTPLRVVFGLPLLLFAPGYAILAALFPEASESTDTSSSDEQTDSGWTLSDGGIDSIERLVLSFGTSIAVVPTVGFLLNLTVGIRLVPIMLALSVLTVGLVAIGGYRRWQLPPNERFAVPYSHWFGMDRLKLGTTGSSTDTVLNVVLALSVLIAVATVGYAVAVPKKGDSFSELYLLTENESGALEAGGYPTDIERGESEDLVVGVTNLENEPTTYTVIIRLERVTEENNQTRVQETSRIRTFEPTLSHDETWEREHTITPQMTGDRLRLQYLLYRGDPGSSVDSTTAYREAHLWINVTSPE